MNNRLLNQFYAEQWAYFFIVLHILCWTFIPALVRLNLPLDTIEGTIWGHQLQWGYDKNPFMNGWLTALATQLCGASGWMTYFFSQLSVGACLWVVWRLTKTMLTPVYALVAVMLLEGVQYFNLHAIDFNDNTLELGLWALGIYFFYQALRGTRPWSWIASGFFLGLGMMAKYYTAALIAPMFLFMFHPIHDEKPWARLAPYLGLVTFLLVILPHTVWLFYHDFITVNYVFDRAGSLPNWTNHFFFPAQFAWQQAQTFLPALVLFAILFIGKRPALAMPKTAINPFDLAFLYYVGLGPFIFTLLLSLFLGINLRAGWGMPLLSLWPILLVALIQPNITKAKLTRFIAVIYLLLAGILYGYSVSLIHSDTPSSANFPGREVAQTITQLWHDNYHTKLAFVAGSRWVGGNIEFYSKDHPSVFVEWDKERAPWINVREMKRKGAVFVWDISEDESLPRYLQAAYPHLSKPMVLEFDWYRNDHHLAPSKIGIAILPPARKYAI